MAQRILHSFCRGFFGDEATGRGRHREVDVSIVAVFCFQDFIL